MCKLITNYHKNKSPDDRELGTGFAHVFDQFVDQFGGGATGRRRAGADAGDAASRMSAKKSSPGSEDLDSATPRGGVREVPA